MHFLPIRIDPSLTEQVLRIETGDVEPLPPLQQNQPLLDPIQQHGLSGVRGAVAQPETLAH